MPQKPRPQGKKLRIRTPIIPKVKEEEAFVAYNHLDTIEYLYDQEDEEWKGEDEYINISQRKPKRKHRSRGPKKETPFRNIFWGTQQSAWMGNIRVKGTIVRSCSRKSDVQAAKILNSRCREKGIDPPNPDVGFIDSKLESKYLGKHQTRKIERSSNEPPVSGQYINDRSILRKFDPLDSVKIERNFDFKLTKTDSTCSNYFKVKLEPEDSYNYVFWSNYETAWIGSYETASGRVLTVKSQESALMAAKMLNSACRDAGISDPNPLVGYIKNDDSSSSDFIIKAEQPIDDSFNDDFQELLKPLNYDKDFDNNYSTARKHLSLETVELPPPVLDEEDFKSMNNLMFKYISDLLPEHTRKYHQDRPSLFDDLPLNSILL